MICTYPRLLISYYLSLVYTGIYCQMYVRAYFEGYVDTTKNYMESSIVCMRMLYSMFLNKEGLQKGNIWCHYGRTVDLPAVACGVAGLCLKRGPASERPSGL
jgi:hypothetical protein